MSEFFEGRKIVKAEELRGPRVYSTDLVTSLYDLGNPADSVEVAERALKIKIITKGLVTLNCAYLVSPVAVRLLERNPDFFAGDAILPVFRSDKSSLADFVSSIGDPKRFGITEAHLSDHIANVQRQIRTVMPWELEGVADTFRTSLVQGLRDPNSVIAELLTTRHGLNASQLERIARDIDTLDLRSSSNLWDYTATLDQAFQKQLNTFAKASYHLVGSAVVRCETGLDLSPLSEVKAANFILAQNARLSDEVLFIERFMDYALEAISPALVPTRIIDSLTFEMAHRVSSALRAYGFQEKYESIIGQYIVTAERDIHRALENLDEERVATVVDELSKLFKQAVIEELPGYRTAFEKDMEDELNAITGEIMLGVTKFMPGVHEVLNARETGENVIKLARGIKKYRNLDQATAFAAAAQRKADEMRAMIARLADVSAGKRARLLDAVALLANLYATAIRPA